jgi:hypothetical protein
VREQEHRTDSRAIYSEQAGEDQQAYDLVTSHLAGWRGQNERQVEEGISVEDNLQRNGHSDGPER